jgi:hypothetical protein
MSKPEKIAAIVAIVQIFKYYGTPHNLLPVFAIIVGAILEHSENPTPQGILDGIITGALTTGSYGVIKGSYKAIANKQNSKKVAEDEDDRCI